jgi:hypothetical protein
VRDTQNEPPYYAFTPLCGWFSSCSLTNNLDISIVANAHVLLLVAGVHYVVEVRHVLVDVNHGDVCVHCFC